MSRSTSQTSLPQQGPQLGPQLGRSRFEKPKDPKLAVRKLLRYFLPYKRELIIILILVILSAFFSLLGPYLIGVSIDQYILKGNVTGLPNFLFILAGIHILNLICQIGQGWLMAIISQKALRKIRLDLLTYLQELSLSFHDKHTSGELMSRLTNDIDAINQVVSNNVIRLTINVLSMVGILVTMFVINIWLALANLMVLPLQFLVTYLIGKHTLQGFRGLQSKLGGLNSDIEETVSGQRAIIAFSQEKSAITKFSSLNLGVRDAGIQAYSYALLIQPMVTVLSNSGIVAVSSLGALLAIQGLVSIGTIATFINYTRSFAEPLRGISELYGSIQTALAGAERVFEILEEKPKDIDVGAVCTIDRFKGSVVFNQVTFSYVPGIPVIKNMSFKAEPGQIIALVGPTGAGKTTIINLLSRFYEIQSGAISIDGFNVNEIDKACLRRELGVVLQDVFLFSGTVMENIKYGRLDATDEECLKAAQMANADQFIRRLPKGYQTILTERGSNLSQGQRQLISIARAIISNPSILVLDEATSSVDTRTEIKIQEALLTLMKGRTNFIIAHRLSTIRNADDVLVINNGEIIEKGTHLELLKRRGFYYHLYMSQFKGQYLKNESVHS